MTIEKEIRMLTTPIELRSDGESTPKVEGYASIFNEETRIGDYFREVFMPGAFRNALKNDDVVFLVNHDGLPLARTRSGTLKLSEDKRGLKMLTELDGEDPDVRQIVPKMKRGDLDKMSIAFLPTRQEWIEPAEGSDELPLRKIHEARLLDVSIVTTPAYDGTEIGLRAWEAYNRESGVPAHVRRARMNMNLALAACRA